jgi:hypothetical protein
VTSFNCRQRLVLIGVGHMRVSVIFFALISLVIPAVCQVKAPVEVVDGGVAAVL